MLRAARPRLRLEPCEDRALPSGLAPIAPPFAPHAVQSPAGGPTEESGPEADEASEYTDTGKATGTPESKPPAAVVAYPKQGETSATDPSAEYGRSEAAEYAPASLPAAPPLPVGPTVPPGPAVVPPAPPTHSGPVTVVAAEGPVSPVIVPPPPALPVSETNVVVPPDDEPADPSPGPPSGGRDQPAVPETEFPSPGPAPSGFPFIDDLDLHVDLGRWASTATRLLDGLDAVVSPLDGDSPWARLGYWALAVGTVGVTVELTRQGLRTRRPESEAGPTLPGVR